MKNDEALTREEQAKRVEALAEHVVKTYRDATPSRMLHHAMRLSHGSMNPKDVREAIARLLKP